MSDPLVDYAKAFGDGADFYLREVAKIDPDEADRWREMVVRQSLDGLEGDAAFIKASIATYLRRLSVIEAEIKRRQ